MVEESTVAVSENFNWKSHKNYAGEFKLGIAPNTRSILALPISVCVRSQAMALLQERLATGTPTRLAFANANLLNVAHGDSGFRSLLSEFLILNDGVGVNLASRMLYGEPFPDNLNGTDFCPDFLETSPVPLRIYLLGGRQSVVARAAEIMAARWPKHCVVGFRDGFFEQSDLPTIKSEIAQKRPDVVFVAMGNGRQERIVDELVPGCTPLACGVGALFDFLAGEVSRAPLIFRTLNMEWVYRLMLEPKRLWRRYVIGNPAFLWRVLMQRFGVK